MTVTLPDGSRLELPEGATGHDAAAAIGPGLAKAAVAVRVGDEIRDLALPLGEGDEIQIVTPKSGDDYLYVMRHSAAHVMAEAVQALIPGTKLGFGPPIDDGFYYDFDAPRPHHRGGLPGHRGRDVADHRRRRRRSSARVMSVADARAFFAEREDPYKVDQIDNLAGQGETSVSLYRDRDFVDLCRGPHVQDTGRIGPVKLQSVAGAYWRGSEKNPQLTRLYATAFTNKKDLEAHLERLEQARARDHRRLGRDLELFHFDELGPGLPVLPAPRAWSIVNGIKEAVREELASDGLRGDPDADDARRPSSGRPAATGTTTARTCTSREVDEQSFAIKPMNCPGACLVYRSRRHSYRELPIRYAEFGHVHRHELSGVLHGLFRVRAFTQDDAHIFCRARPGVGRGQRDPRPHRPLLRPLRVRARRAEAVDPPGEGDRRRRRCGTRPRRRCARRSATAPTASRRATAPSTGRRSTSRSPTSWAARGSSAPASSTSGSRSASTSSSPTPTTRRSGR